MTSVKEKVLLGLGGTAATGIVAWRTLFPYIGYDLELLKAAKRARTMITDLENRRLVIDMFEETVQRTPKKTFLIFEDRAYTYQFINEQACKVANIAATWGLKQGQTVAIFITNEPAFIWTFLGRL